MEIKLDSTSYHYLKQMKWETQSQEQTQELRLPDGMPDIGSVLGCWGQVLIRGKEWSGGRVGVSGGIMCWIMYAPEDGTLSQIVEAWLPFQMKWEIPNSNTDGTICVRALLRNVDARNTSARKMIVRANVELLGQILVPNQAQISAAEQLPADVEILKKQYPIEIFVEAGEKYFEVEECISLPASVPKLDSLICYTLQPEITERKLLGDKAVFRGMCILHLVYQTDQGQINAWDCEIPFSQYSELDKNYDTEGQVRVVPVISGLELDRMEDGKYQLKASVISQYLISQRTVVTIVEDVYSNTRPVTVKTEMCNLPAIIIEKTESVPVNQMIKADNHSAVDVSMYPSIPRIIQKDGKVSLELDGQIQLLCQQSNENPQGYHSSWEESRILDICNDMQINASVYPSGKPEIMFDSDGVQVRGELLLDVCCLAQNGMTMVTELELGEIERPDPERPSLVLRKAGDDSLWTLAKKCGSTVEAILIANDLDGEPEPDRLLLIPVS